MNHVFKRKLSKMEEFDEKIIANMPWAQNFLAISSNITHKAVLNWCKIVCKSCEAELQTDEYVKIFLDHLKNLYEEMIADLDAIREESLNKIMRLLQRMHELCLDLHLEIPQFNYEEVPLCELYKTLLEKVKEYEFLVETRRIDKKRQELEELWNKCHCSEKEKSEFNFLYSKCYNENLFELYDCEIEKWKRFYQENQELFLLLNKYKNLWRESLELEMNSGGSTRYENRGGYLLLEEKLRNKFKKQISKLEHSLIKLADTYYHVRGKDFTTFGQTVPQFIKTLHQDAEKEFKRKLSAKKQKREQLSPAGGSRMNLFPPSKSSPNLILTPPQGSKRKVLTEPAKKLKSKTGSQRKSKSGMPKVNINRRRSGRREKLLREKLSFTNSSGENSNKKEVTSKSNNCRSTGHNIRIGLIPPTPPPTEKEDFLKCFNIF